MRRVTRFFALWSLVLIGNSYAESPKEWIARELPGVVELYRQFHLAPELSLQEEKTSAKLAQEWRSVGAVVTEKVGGFGVVAVLENGNGPTVLVRTDMDALPVEEMTNLVYASSVKVRQGSGETGVMHACGHDIHMASAVAVARYLAANRDLWQGTVVFIGQPAEERGLGAKNMLDDGLFKRFPKPDFALALHVDATLETGKVGYRAGYALANVDSVDITIRGKGGHGASPETTIDPIVQAAHLILDLQTIVSREIRPIDPAVITVGSIHGGTKHNIIPDNCQLQLTVRSYTDQVRTKLLSAIERKAKAVAASAGAPEPEIKISEGTPAMYNDDKLVERLLPVMRRVLPARDVVPSEPSMGGEDFSQYGLAGVPIFMFRLGSVDAQRFEGYKRVGQEPPSLHSPVYYPDAEPTLSTGVLVMSEMVLDLLSKK